MLVNELLSLVKEGKKPVVKFKENIEELVSDCAYPQMMAKFTGATIDERTDFLILVKFDLRGFESYNKSILPNDWVVIRGNQTLNWFDSDFYPKDGMMEFFLPKDDEIPFDFVGENVLLKEYAKSKTKMTYLEWLEEQVLNLRVR